MSPKTPRTNAQRSNQNLPLAMGYVPASFAEELELELNQKTEDFLQAEESRQKNAELLDYLHRHHQQKLETDSIIGSCECCVKTPDIQYHKKGCKYRLIVERNQALDELSVAKSALKELRQELWGFWEVKNES